MANFKTHISVAAVASGITATALLGLDIITTQQALLLWSLGALGGILPDIDSDHSHALKIIFNLLALLLLFLVMLGWSERLSIIEIWITCGFIYTGISFWLPLCFARFTIHRGIFHSLLSAAFFTFIVVALCHHLFVENAVLAWLSGIFLALGFITHLLLDEFYSVNFSNASLKRSFGSAFKLLDFNNRGGSLAMILACCGAYYLTPDIDTLWIVLGDALGWQNISDHLWPQHGWFAIFY